MRITIDLDENLQPQVRTYGDAAGGVHGDSGGGVMPIGKRRSADARDGGAAPSREDGKPRTATTAAKGGGPRDGGEAAHKLEADRY
jgi:hypothetical protein